MLIIKRRVGESLELRDADSGALLGHIHVLHIFRNYQVKLGIDLHPGDIAIRRVQDIVPFQKDTASNEASSIKSA